MSSTIEKDFSQKNPDGWDRPSVFLGFLLAFFSGFGQTFFIAIFMPVFQSTVRIDNKEFGFMYAVVTLISGLLLGVFGAKLDRANIFMFIQVTIIGMVSSGLLIAASTNWLLLFIAILGLRFFGQGLFSHIAATIVAKRSVVTNRGTALSIVSLGYPVSEALLPIVGVLLLNWSGWRLAWFAYAVFIAILFPITYHLQKKNTFIDKSDPTQPKVPVTPLGQKIKKLVLFQPKFWFWGIGSLISPGVLTALFLYSSVLGSQKGWTLEMIASSFVAFAVGRFVFSLVGGLLVDRFGATRLYPIYLLPLAIGLLCAVYGTSQAALLAYLFLAGITVGIGGPLKTALIAEVFGLRILASVRSQLATLGIIATAIGPAVMGYCLEDIGWDMSFILKILALVIIVYIVITQCLKPAEIVNISSS